MRRKATVALRGYSAWVRTLVINKLRVLEARTHPTSHTMDTVTTEHV